MRLKRIKDSNAKGYLILTFSCEGADESFCVSESQYASIGSPLIGDEISEDSYRALCALDERNRAKRRALSILSFGDNSRAALIMKLRRAGFSRSVSESVADEMVSLGYIDEVRQLKRLIREEVISRLSGPRKYTARLYSKGYPVSLIKEVSAELIRSGEIDLSVARARLTEKYSPGSEEEERALLYKHGF